MNCIQLFLLVFLTISCQSQSKKASIVAIDSQKTIRSKALSMGLSVEGRHVLTISGDEDKLRELTSSYPESTISDEVLKLGNRASLELEDRPMYLAKKDFALGEFLVKNPTSDGRGVIVGVIDDGISPDQVGFKNTTTGQRKILKRQSQSSAFRVSLTKDDQGDLVALLSEKKDAISYHIDLNLNKEIDTYNVKIKPKGGEDFICIDLDMDKSFENECVRSFSASGDYIYWSKENSKVLTAEYDKEAMTVKFFQGEGNPRDSHGEGVASVMAGHNIGQRFDGVAPGAQILDYDLSELSFDRGESEYTISTFVNALRWMGENNADIVNISYSIFFDSAKSQAFMQKILKSLVEEYKFIVTFSAGNDGAALGTMSRGLIYPENSLVVGAYASYDLEEYVHGVTGLPEEGTVIRYSSRGPSPDQGTSPTVISPMASLVHHSSGYGYRAFSGTSSAAPAMGGLVASLLSHIRLNKLEYDYSALIHAVKMSATPLEHAGYVEQGFGLPKAEKAIAIYKQIITAKAFKNTRLSLSPVETPNISKRGLVVEYDKLKTEAKEYLLNIKALASDLVATNVSQNMLKTITLSSNVDWIRAPRQTHLSLSTSKAYILVSAPENMEEGGHQFGEISISDSETGLVYAKLPITLVRPFKASVSKESYSWKPTILSDSAKRSFISIDDNVDALKLSYDNPNFDASSYLELYDPQGNKIFKTDKPGFTSILPTAIKGNYQIVMNRRGGSYKAYEPKITVQAMSLDTVDPIIFSDDPSLLIRNNFKSGLYRIRLYKKTKALETYYKRAKLNEDAVFSFELEPGSHQYRFSTQRQGLIRRSRSRCKGRLLNKDNETLKHYNGGDAVLRVKVKESYGKTKLEVTCYNFERSDVVYTDLKTTWKLEKIPLEVVSKESYSAIARLTGEGEITNVKLTKHIDHDFGTSFDIDITSSENLSRGLTVGEVKLSL